MSKSISPTALGAFVIGAIILMVAAVLIFSSGSFFSQNYTAVVVFPGNVKGLVVGAPVEMRGVKIGSVKSIEILFDKKSKSITVPVYLEINPNALSDAPYSNQSEKVTSNEAWRDELSSLINVGLKAELSLKSLVTGQLIVDVDFYPDSPINLTNIDNRFPEIPTRETMTDRVINSLQKLPLPQLFNKAIKVLDDIDQLVTSEGVKDALISINQLLENMDSEVKPLSSSIKSTLSDISSLTIHANSKLDPLSESAVQTLLETKYAMSSINDLMSKDSVTRVDLDNTLNELAKAATSIRTLTDYLERHPEALLKGKGY